MNKEAFRILLRRAMDVYTWVMLIGAALLLIGVYSFSPDSATRGLNASLMLFLEILPRMVAAFVFAGLVQVMVPQEAITHWMGQESGFRGLLIGMILGTLTPGGPMMHFPIVASFYKSGVGVGPLVSYLTAWSLFGFQRMVMWEFPFLGVNIVAVRTLSSLFFPILAGWISALIWVRYFTPHP
jgi:uncharacterized membrane protein YraQ (UPF0718 family)